MKYSLYIHQVKAIDLGIKNINQGLIFDFLTSASTWAETEIVNNEVYYWVSRQKICKELALLNMKPDTVYRHLKSLDLIGVIEYIKVGKKDCIRVTKKGKTYLLKDDDFPYVGNKSELDENSEINPDKLGNRSEKDSEINPTYNTTSINTTTKDTLFQVWNETAKKNGLPTIKVITKERRSKIATRVKDLDDFSNMFIEACSKIENSQYLRGSRGWQISFDWLLENNGNVVKVVEGNYDDNKPTVKKSNLDLGKKEYKGGKF